MDPANSTLSEAEIQTLIQEAYVSYVYNIITIGVIALLIYTTLLQISQEVESIWTRRFSIPSLLYVLARYPVIITQSIYFVINLLPESTPERTCNILYNVSSAFSILTFLGVQGLLVARAYALCRGGKIVTTLLAFAFFAGVLFLLLEVILFDTCTFNLFVPTSERVIDLLGNIFGILIDVLSFCLCLYKVWGTWKSKRDANLHGGNNLASILFKQIISRFCFTVIISVTYAIIGQFLADPIITASLSSIQAGISVILISDFTLALREDNSSMIDANNATLVTIRTAQDILQQMHQTFIVELGDEYEESCEDSSGRGSVTRVDSLRNCGVSDTV